MTTTLPRLIVLLALLGWSGASASPTSINSNGFNTAVGAPVNGTYNITGGFTTGTNLFHSFSTFNLGTGATANFNVSSNVTNILARVTGGPSTIDGTITSTIGGGATLSNANLFFINPAGVMFTSNAQVNLGGSFIVSTANEIALSDGTTFFADATHTAQDALLTTAPVSAFGFLSTTPQSVSFFESQLSAPAGHGIHVIGGDISLSGAGGVVNGVTSPGASLSAPSGNLTLFSAGSRGMVPFSLDSPGAGYATATVTKFGAISMTKNSSAEIDGNGGGSMVIRGGKITVDNSGISSGDFGDAPGGAILVQADKLTVSSGGYIFSDTYGASNSGNITVNVTNDLEISGTGSQISSDTESSGAGGIVTANVGAEVRLDGGDMFTNVSSAAARGHGGSVVVNANSMSLSGNARISAATNGPGDAGTVKLTLAGPLSLSDTGRILADTNSGAKGGDVIIAASQISMTGESLIEANTALSGSGGNVTIKTNSISIEGTGTEPAGTLGITAESFFGSGSAGMIDITASNLALSGGALVSSAAVDGSGHGGMVSLSFQQGTLSSQSVVSASALVADAGSIQITARDSLSITSGSSVTTSSGESGGNVTLVVGRLLYLNDGNIQAFAGVPTPGHQAVLGTKGGNILIDPQFVALNNSYISANDLSSGGTDGNIINTADFFFSSNSQLFATGTIITTSPDLDLARGLAYPPPDFVSASNRLRENCARSITHDFSSFIEVGRGGTESAPEELQPDFGFGD